MTEFYQHSSRLSLQADSYAVVATASFVYFSNAPNVHKSPNFHYDSEQICIG